VLAPGYSSFSYFMSLRLSVAHCQPLENHLFLTSRGRKISFRSFPIPRSFSGRLGPPPSFFFLDLKNRALAALFPSLPFFLAELFLRATERLTLLFIRQSLPFGKSRLPNSKVDFFSSLPPFTNIFLTPFPVRHLK